MSDDKNSFKNTIKINRNKINDEMSEHAEHLYVIGVKIEKLWKKVRNLENELERKESTLAVTYRNQAKREGRAVSETAVKEKVKANPEIVELKNELTRWKGNYRLAVLKRNVLNQKGEMMVNISHNVREEKKKSHVNKT